MAEIMDDPLRQQFEALQLQQQQRLKRRKELKEQKKQVNGHGDQTSSNGLQPENTVSSFGIDDNLDLKLEDPLPKTASYVSEELVDHLNEQISEMKDENTRLFKLLSERDFEIRQLKKKREEEKLAFGGSSKLSSDSAASKIVELSKKNRELSASLEAKKTECQQLFGRCRHLENEIAKKELEKGSPRLNSVVPVNETSPRSVVESEAKIKQLQDKLRLSEQRNSEYRNTVQSLKNEIKLAQKVLVQEIGEGVHIHELANTQSQWRGRAQQIIALQKKVGDLKQQLQEQSGQSTYRTNGTVTRSAVDDLESQFMGHTGATKGADMKQREIIRKLERERKDQQEKASAELKALEGDYDALKQKMEASKARNKVLSNENKSFRGEMQKLVDKGKHDDELIAALIVQQTQMKKMIEDLSALQQQNQQSQQERMSAISAKNQQESNVIQQLKSIVSEKEQKVKTLEKELVELKNAKILESQKKSVDSLFTDKQIEQLEVQSLSPSPPPTQRPKSEAAYSRHGTRPLSSGKGTHTLNTGSGSRPPTGRNESRPTTAENVSDLPMTGAESRPPTAAPITDDESAETQIPTSSRPPTSKSMTSRPSATRLPSSHKNNKTPTNTSRPGTSNRPSSGRKSVQSARGREREPAIIVKYEIPPETTERLSTVELQCQEYQSLAQAAQVEREKLMELLQLTQKRLDEANDQALLYQKEMKVHKQTAVQLEKTVGKLRLEYNSKSAGAGSVRKQREKSMMGSSISLGSAVDLKAKDSSELLEDLETKLAIQKDENEALKVALESTLQAKEEDLRLYNDMIEQTKLVFMQGLKHFKNSTAQPSANN